MSQEKSLNSPLVVITGPTASGKTALATHLAATINGEVISADSRQVYKRMDIGTGKDLSEYIVNGKPIPYHLIDICEPGETFNVYQFQKYYAQAIQQIQSNHNIPILSGGTGLYIEAVTLEGYEHIWIPRNEELRVSLEGKTVDELSVIYDEIKTNHDDHKGIEHRERSLIRAIEIESFLKSDQISNDRPVDIPQLQTSNFAILIDKDTRWKKIEKRLDERFKEGMIDEVKALLDEVGAEKLKSFGLEYRHITEYLLDEISFEEMREILMVSIRKFSKRQMTWFRRMEKKTQIHWMPVEWEMEKKIDFVRTKTGL
ncbi:tRNA (adenosine(37)-N6)-dimethylallyltransferase MiaA [Flammeovirga sp. EKP202]|uniref:tRNA (adenosine(37)-N6)-dimethylallyltransferase MiaA n=1 Tax=Flammeovirga sp. EKP202 TaxID=2770592 RepID=UPI00165EEB2C|nr:tRNA (adenosine(37)-N6)-dimethylallyltransferase MiaA [Flammeovirga sp. EKP202]MBD0402123.1 tRNA (adenosine(37)-N6)-dimethylallyltransferase MiaA [Flammeovirga sp. EKP202]